jgi:hypothetical protein
MSEGLKTLRRRIKIIPSNKTLGHCDTDNARQQQQQARQTLIDEANTIVKHQQTKKLPDETKIRYAEMLYDQVLKAFEHSPDLRYSLYRTCMLRNDCDGACYHIKKALEDCGNYVPAMKAIGEILNSMEEDSAETKQLKNVYDRYRQDYFEFFELSTTDDESGMEYIE